jgi:hypothetical protein
MGSAGASPVTHRLLKKLMHTQVIGMCQRTDFASSLLSSLVVLLYMGLLNFGMQKLFAARYFT